MQRNLISLRQDRPSATSATTVPRLQPLGLLAQDQDQNSKDTKDAAGSPNGTGGKAQGGQATQIVSGGGASHDKVSSDKSVDANGPVNAGTQNIKVAKQGFQPSKRGVQSQQKQGATFAVQGNRANSYNGQWVAASTHSDWDVNTDHNWNNHDYRYYDGGWLIIDIGAVPAYTTAGSVGANVQQSLAQQGYYNGPIDGDIGRGTRRAISHYERDNGLQVNGQIDGPLLASLGLQN